MEVRGAVSDVLVVGFLLLLAGQAVFSQTTGMLIYTYERCTSCLGS